MRINIPRITPTLIVPPPTAIIKVRNRVCSEFKFEINYATAILVNSDRQSKKRVWLISGSWQAPIARRQCFLEFISGFRIASRKIATEYDYSNCKGLLDNYFIIEIPFIDLVLRFDKAWNNSSNVY